MTEVSTGAAVRRRPLLHVDHLSKTYPGQVALDGARLDVWPGEVHAVVGQNGSGKSTLIKLLGGYVKADHGARVAFDGRPVDLWSMPADLRRRIRIVHQDLGLVPTLSAVENLGLGHGFETGALGHIRWRTEVERAQQALLRFGLAPDVRQPVGTLSATERAAIAIVRALQDWAPGERGILVLDEPTATLNRGEVLALFREVRRVASEGNGVIFVSHILDEVLDLADRITVLRDGKVVAAGVPARDLDHDQLVELIVGRRVDDLYGAPRAADPGRAVLEVQGLFGITLRGFSVKVHEGEVVGVAGLVGSGREEVAGAIFGATPRFAGKVLVDKRKVFAEPRESIKARVAYVPADRKGLGLIPSERVVEHVPLPSYGSLRRGLRLDHRATRRDVATWVERLDVQPPILDRRLEKFSGGNQQKVVLARWLRTAPRVLLLDEPTQGVDVGAKAAIYEQIALAKEHGLAVLVASSDAEELVNTCDRVLVLRGGMLAAELSGRDLVESRVVAETLGATSNRGGMRTTRRRPAVRVIRDDPPVPAGAPAGVAVATASGPAPRADEAVPLGRLATWARRARTRFSRRPPSEGEDRE